MLGILKNRIYLGEMLRGAYSQRMGGKSVKMPREQWEYRKGVLPPIVDNDLFERVEARLRSRARSSESMLEDLRALYERRGHIGTAILGGANGTARYHTYVNRFGSMQAALDQAGVTDRIREELLKRLRMLAGSRTRICPTHLLHARGFPNPVKYRRYFGSLEAACERIGITLERHPEYGPSRPSKNGLLEQESS